MLIGQRRLATKKKEKIQSQFGEDIIASVGLGSLSNQTSLEVGYGRRNRNAMKGRKGEREKEAQEVGKRSKQSSW